MDLHVFSCFSGVGVQIGSRTSPVIEVLCCVYDSEEVQVYVDGELMTQTQASYSGIEVERLGKKLLILLSLLFPSVNISQLI